MNKETNSSRIAPGYKEAFSTLKNAFFGYDKKIDPELILNIPYASMLVRIGNGPESLMILESVIGDEYYWVSADGVYIVTKAGRVIKTTGLPNNLNQIESSVFNLNSINIADKIYKSYFSFLNPTLNNLEVASSFEIFNPTEEVLIFGNLELKLIVETIVSESIGWKEENKYWLDEENFIRKSVQHISPKLPPIYIEVTKRPQ